VHDNVGRISFAKGKCHKCEWVGHGSQFRNGAFICTYCDPDSAKTAAESQKDYWLKGGYIKWYRPKHQ